LAGKRLSRRNRRYGKVKEDGIVVGKKERMMDEAVKEDCIDRSICRKV